MAASFVSFDDVKSQVSIEDVLRRYGYFDSLQQKGAQLVGLCPFHKESTPSFKVTPARNIWNCFGACQRGGDQIDLVCVAEGIATGDRTRDRRQAALLLQEWFGLASSSQPPKETTGRGRVRRHKQAHGTDRTEHRGEATTTASVPEAATDDEKAASNTTGALPNQPLTFTFRNLDPTHPYLAEQGLTAEAIAHFEIGYHAGRGVMHGRIAIPIHDEQGRLIAYAGRWPGDDPPEGEDKYRFPPNFKKSLVLYNLHRAREHAGAGLIVVEGFISGVFTLWQLGRRNVVGIMGSSLSETQERLVVQTVGQRGRVLLMFDDDEAGRKGMADAAARLVTQVFVRTRPLS